MPKIKKKILLVFAVMLIGLGTCVQAANFPINATLKQSIKRSTYNQLLSREVELESQYDLREDDGMDITVKDQKKSQSCWAFAYSSLLEISAKKQQPEKKAKEYSPMHLEYMTANMFNRKKGSRSRSKIINGLCRKWKWTSRRK